MLAQLTPPKTQVGLTKEDVYPPRSTTSFDSKTRLASAAKRITNNKQFALANNQGHLTVNIPASSQLFSGHAGLQSKFDAFITALGGADEDVTQPILQNMLKTGEVTQMKKSSEATDAEFTLVSRKMSDEELKEIQTQKDFLKTFIPKFSRLHYLILYEIYMYLMKVYTNFNLTSVGTMDEFLAAESKIDGAFVNQKTMVINHLINLIEAQVNEFVTQKWPSIHKKAASITGSQFMRIEGGADIAYMVRELEEDFTTFNWISTDRQTQMKGKQNTYLETFGKYLAFFQEYTGDLLNTNPETGLNKFIDHAERIGKLIDGMKKNYQKDIDAINTNNKALIEKAKTVKPTATGLSKAEVDDILKLAPQAKVISDTIRKFPRINPPLFFYNKEVLRSLRLIPHIAQTLPKDSKQISWPSQLIANAQNNTKIQTGKKNIWTSSAFPAGVNVANMYDANLNETTDITKAEYLALNIPKGDGIYQQQLVPEPDWMSSPEGIMSMLRACLGDFSALLAQPLLYKENILDPCTGHVIYQAAKLVGGASALGIPASVGQEAQTASKQFLALLGPPEGVPDGPSNGEMQLPPGVGG